MTRRRAGRSLGVGLALSALVLSLQGCLFLLKVPDMVDEMGGLPVTGVEFFRYEGQTKYQEPYRIRHVLDPAGGRRYRVVVVDGRVLESAWENVTSELAAGSGVWGTPWQGRSEAEVRGTFGPPTTATEAGDIRTLWYMGRREGSFGVIFRDGRLLVAFLTSPRELDDLLARRPPY